MRKKYFIIIILMRLDKLIITTYCVSTVNKECYKIRKEGIETQLWGIQTLSLEWLEHH